MSNRLYGALQYPVMISTLGVTGPLEEGPDEPTEKSNPPCAPLRLLEITMISNAVTTKSKKWYNDSNNKLLL